MRAHPLGACHRRGYLPGLLTVGLDVTSSLTEVSAKRLSGFPLPAAENVMHLLEVLPNACKVLARPFAVSNTFWIAPRSQRLTSLGVSCPTRDPYSRTDRKARADSSSLVR